MHKCFVGWTFELTIEASLGYSFLRHLFLSQREATSRDMEVGRENKTSSDLALAKLMTEIWTSLSLVV